MPLLRILSCASLPDYLKLRNECLHLKYCSILKPYRSTTEVKCWRALHTFSKRLCLHQWIYHIAKTPTNSWNMDILPIKQTGQTLRWWDVNCVITANMQGWNRGEGLPCCMTVSPAMCVTGNMASNMSLEKERNVRSWIRLISYLASRPTFIVPLRLH